MAPDEIQPTPTPLGDPDPPNPEQLLDEMLVGGLDLSAEEPGPGSQGAKPAGWAPLRVPSLIEQTRLAMAAESQAALPQTAGSPPISHPSGQTNSEIGSWSPPNPDPTYSGPSSGPSLSNQDKLPQPGGSEPEAPRPWLRPEVPPPPSQNAPVSYPQPDPPGGAGSWPNPEMAPSHPDLSPGPAWPGGEPIPAYDGSIPPGPEEDLPFLQRPSVRQMQAEVSALYGDIREWLSPNQEAARRARFLLSEAQTILKNQPERLEEIPQLAQQVRELIRYAQVSQRWADVYSSRLLIYLSAWFVLALVSVLYLYFFNGDSYLGSLFGLTPPPLSATSFLIATGWGAIGGVISGVHSLWWHVSEVQDFDGRFNGSYLLRPFLGALLGALVYIVLVYLLSMIAGLPARQAVISLAPTILAFLFGLMSGPFLSGLGLAPRA